MWLQTLAIVLRFCVTLGKSLYSLSLGFLIEKGDDSIHLKEWWWEWNVESSCENIWNLRSLDICWSTKWSHTQRAWRHTWEPGPSWWVGSRFNKQGSIITSLNSHSCKMRCSPTTIIKVSTEVLMGSVTSILQSSQQPVLSRLWPYK